MPGGLVGHAHAGGNELACIRSSQAARSFTFLQRRLALLLALQSLNNSFAHDQSINDQRQANHERNDSSNPETSDYRGHVGLNFADNSLHEYKQKNCDPDADTTHNHASLDLVVTFHLRRDAKTSLHLQFAQLRIELFACVRSVNRFTHCVQICSARRTKLYVVTLI